VVVVVETRGTRVCMPVVSPGVVDGLSTLVATRGKVGGWSRRRRRLSALCASRPVVRRVVDSRVVCA
jgi:hypothetical protein